MGLKQRAKQKHQKLRERIQNVPEFGRVWEPPKLHAREGGGKAAGWWELFFDLTCVASMGTAAHLVVAAINHVGGDEHRRRLSGGGACEVTRGDMWELDDLGTAALQVTFGMTSLLQVWLQETLFATRFDGGDDVLHRLLKAITFFGAAGIGVNMTYCIELDESFRRGAASYAVARISQSMRVCHALWLAKCDVAVDWKAWVLMFGFGVVESFLMFANYLIGDTQAKFIYVSTVVFVVSFSRLPLARKIAPELRPNAHHFPERLGLLVILTLGECVIQLIHNGSQLSQTLYEAAAGFIVLSIWWIYFDNIVGDIVNHWLTFDIWVALHLPLVVGIVLLAATISLFLNFAATDDGWEKSTKTQKKVTLWLFCIAMSSVSLCVSIIRSLNTRRKERDHKIFNFRVYLARIFWSIVYSGVYLLFPIFRDDWTVLGLLQVTCGIQAFRIVGDISGNFRYQLRLAAAKEKSLLEAGEELVATPRDNEAHGEDQHA